MSFSEERILFPGGNLLFKNGETKELMVFVPRLCEGGQTNTAMNLLYFLYEEALKKAEDLLKVEGLPNVSETTIRKSVEMIDVLLLYKQEPEESLNLIEISKKFRTEYAYEKVYFFFDSCGFLHFLASTPLAEFSDKNILSIPTLPVDCAKSKRSKSCKKMVEKFEFSEKKLREYLLKEGVHCFWVKGMKDRLLGIEEFTARSRIHFLELDPPNVIRDFPEPTSDKIDRDVYKFFYQLFSRC